jgi:hypothetical protein
MGRRRALSLASLPFEHRSFAIDSNDAANRSLNTVETNLNEGQCEIALTHLIDASSSIGAGTAHIDSPLYDDGVAKDERKAARLFKKEIDKAELRLEKLKMRFVDGCGVPRYTTSKPSEQTPKPKGTLRFRILKGGKK